MCVIRLARCMTCSAVWMLDFKTRQYLKGSLWFLPRWAASRASCSAFSSLSPTRVGHGPDVPGLLGLDATSLLAAIVGSTAALTGFVVTVSVLVVQMATITFSARYMRLWYRDWVLHVLLAMLVGTFMFSFTLLAGVEETPSRTSASP